MLPVDEVQIESLRISVLGIKITLRSSWMSLQYSRIARAQGEHI
jgi:hypothetical protein